NIPKSRTTDLPPTRTRWHEPVTSCAAPRKVISMAANDTAAGRACRLSVGAQRGHRIDTGGAARRYHAGEDRDREQHDACADDRGRIARTDAIEQAARGACREKRSAPADTEPRHHKPRRLGEHARDKRRPVGAERHPNSKLVRPLSHRPPRDAVKAQPPGPG